MAQDTTRQLLDVLRRLQSTSGVLDSARVLRDGRNVLRAMTVEQRRALAVDVASLVAPELVPQIEAEGNVDLTVEQVGTVLDMMRRLDVHQIAQLRDRLEHRASPLALEPERAPPPRTRPGVRGVLQHRGPGLAPRCPRERDRPVEDVARDFVKAKRPTSLIERAASVEEVANMIVYTASKEASATSGAALRVEGGIVDTIV